MSFCFVAVFFCLFGPFFLGQRQRVMRRHDHEAGGLTKECPNQTLPCTSTQLHCTGPPLRQLGVKKVVKMHFLDGMWDTGKSDSTGLRRRTLVKRRR